jgi:holo-[acyl-carrier protein] synthase
MTVHVGIDLVDVQEVAESVSRFGDRYLERVFASNEIAACADGANSRKLSACFAAKEATVKALALTSESIDLRSIEVKGLSSDRPALALSGKIAEIADRENVSRISISISMAREYAAAVAIIEKPCKEGAGAI